MAILQVIKSFLRRLGVLILRNDVRNNPFKQLLSAIEKSGANLIFDIGANEGQFSSELRKAGFEGEIICFEPLSKAYKVLLENASKFYFKVHQRCAIGDRIEETLINVSNNSVSSSLLPISNIHTQSAPKSKYVDSESVKVITLDSLIPVYLNIDSKLFLKLDTQGFEWNVLMGGKEILNRTVALSLELSFQELYVGQKLWFEIVDFLHQNGFYIWAIQKGFTNPVTGQSLQADVIFLKTTN
jgi:FkbM family methyltransferase